MTDEELIARLRSMHWCVTTKANGVGVSDGAVAREAADRIEELEAKLAKAVEALEHIAAEAAVPVYTWKNGINFKKMYEGWRKIATKRIDIARTTLAEIKGGNDAESNL